jgi:hypothetical protein
VTRYTAGRLQDYIVLWTVHHRGKRVYPRNQESGRISTFARQPVSGVLLRLSNQSGISVVAFAPKKIQRRSRKGVYKADEDPSVAFVHAHH